MKAYEDDPVYKHTDLVSPYPPPTLRQIQERTYKKRKTEDRLAQPQPKATKSHNYRTDRQIKLDESLNWFNNKSNFDVSSILTLKIEPATDNNTQDIFCMKIVIDQLNESKQRSSNIPKEIFRTARGVANPYEMLGKNQFLNRSAIKLANLDYLCNLIPSASSFEFADICGGPGGFTEYLFWRCSRLERKIRGWGNINLKLGITLKGVQDYQINETKEVFQALYGKDGTGDIYSLENIKTFSETVLAESETGITLCVCDGGFVTKEDEYHQEEQMKHLILGQVLICFKILSNSGTAVFKFFDTLLPFTVELIYILSMQFEKIAIVKPFSSRPANSERFIICKEFNPRKLDEIILHLEKCFSKMNELKNTQKPAKSAHATHQPGFIPYMEKVQLGLLDVTHILDADAVLRDEDFIEFIQGSNMTFAVKQRQALDDIYEYSLEQKPKLWDQEDISNKLLSKWALIS